MPISHQKLLQLQSYDDIIDPEDHAETVDILLSFCNA